MLAKVCSYLSYLALFLAYAVTGFSASFIIDYWRKFFELNLPGKPLPAMTLFVVALDHLLNPTIAGLILGALFPAILIWLQRSPLRHSWIPVCLSFAWGLCALYLWTVLVGLNLAAPPTHIYPIPERP